MTSTAATATEIRPFTVNVPEDKLIDLRRRITATQWPEKETVVDQSQGVQLEVHNNRGGMNNSGDCRR